MSNDDTPFAGEPCDTSSSVRDPWDLTPMPLLLPQSCLNDDLRKEMSRAGPDDSSVQFADPQFTSTSTQPGVRASEPSDIAEEIEHSNVPEPSQGGA